MLELTFKMLSGSLGGVLTIVIKGSLGGLLIIVIKNCVESLTAVHLVSSAGLLTMIDKDSMELVILLGIGKAKSKSKNRMGLISCVMDDDKSYLEMPENIYIIT